MHTVVCWAQSKNSYLIDKNDVTLIGHSRAGGVTSIVAKESKFVSKLITWAGVSDFKKRFPKKDRMEEWKEKGVFYVKNGRTKQEMPHFFSFYEDFIENQQRLNIKSAIKQLRKPQLIIHGDNDEAVYLKEAELLKQWNSNAELEIIVNANHTFGSKHPWVEDKLPKDLQRVVNRTIEFI